MNDEETKKLYEYCERVLDLKNAKLSDEYFYQSLPLCIIDAVFSIGVKYEGTRRTVIRYCEHFNLQRIRKDKERLPAIETQESIREFVKKMIFLGIDKFTTEIFCNKQRKSTRSGILKTEAVYRFATILKDYDVNYIQDVPKVINSVDFEKDIKSIPGQGSGISLGYFFMLSGSDDLIKPDRHILAFIKRSFGKKISAQHAQILLEESCNVLKLNYPHLTQRLLDHMIWKYQKSDVKHLDEEKPGLSRIEDKKTKHEEPTYTTELLGEKDNSEYNRIEQYSKSESVLSLSDADTESQSKTSRQSELKRLILAVVLGGVLWVVLSYALTFLFGIERLGKLPLGACILGVYISLRG